MPTAAPPPRGGEYRFVKRFAGLIVVISFAPIRLRPDKLEVAGCNALTDVAGSPGLLLVVVRYFSARLPTTVELFPWAHAMTWHRTAFRIGRCAILT